MSAVLTSISPAARAIRTRRQEKVAVLLNANARKVTESVRRDIARFVPEEDVYLTRSMPEAGAAIADALDRGCTTFLVGGGDGTFVHAMNEVLSHRAETEVDYVLDGSAVRKAVARRPPVRFGVLRLGTGNALAGLTGASASQVGMIEEILRTRSGDMTAVKRLHMVRVDGKAAPFASLGADARVLTDFLRVRKAMERTPLARAAGGVLGYLGSAITLTVPALTFEGKAPNAVVINEGAPVQQIGPDGRNIGKPIPTGGVIYSGPCRHAAVGTVPNYGFGFTMFPHASRIPAGRMQLRLTAMSAVAMLSHLPALWQGRVPSPSILDFSAEKVSIKLDKALPLQVGGDPAGMRDEIRYAVDPNPIDLIDFKAKA